MTTAPDHSPLHREDIKAAVRKRGLTLVEVGRDLIDGEPVGRSTVTDVLARRTTSLRVEVALSLASGYTLAEVQQVTRTCPRRATNDGDNDGDTGSPRTGRQARAAA